jgi:hypothetical protein
MTLADSAANVAADRETSSDALVRARPDLLRSKLDSGPLARLAHGDILLSASCHSQPGRFQH